MAVMVRGLALGEPTFRSAGKVVLKEIAVGFANGATTGVIMAGFATLWYGNPWLGLIISPAMIANLMVAGLSGAADPDVWHYPRLSRLRFLAICSWPGGQKQFGRQRLQHRADVVRERSVHSGVNQRLGLLRII